MNSDEKVKKRLSYLIAEIQGIKAREHNALKLAINGLDAGEREDYEKISVQGYDALCDAVDYYKEMLYLIEGSEEEQ